MFALLRVGSSEAVLHRVGRVPAEILMCAIILCIGPMVAIPRTSASTFEMAIAPNLPGVSPVLFSILFFAVILALCIKESAVVDIVGKILTPLLLVGLCAIILKGIFSPLGDILTAPKIANVTVTGIKSGYQTMDALAALPFGIIVLQSVTDKGYTGGKSKLRLVGGGAVLAGVLLLAVYMGLAYLGATVSGQYTSAVGRAELIMAIVGALLGKGGMIIFGAVVGLACVTTAIALTSSAAAYFSELCRGKVKYKVFVVIICVFSAVVSNLGPVSYTHLTRASARRFLASRVLFLRIRRSMKFTASSIALRISPSRSSSWARNSVPFWLRMVSSTTQRFFFSTAKVTNASASSGKYRSSLLIFFSA